MTVYQYPNYLMHHGVKGMKWGVRKKRSQGTMRSVSRDKKWYGTTKNGEQIYLQRDRVNPVAKGVQFLTRKDFASYSAYNYKGEKVGNIQLDRKSKKEMNTTWMEVNKNHGGKGYAQTMQNLGEQISRDMGASKMTGEVIGLSPNMLHISEKNGYAKIGEVKTKEMMDSWGGLTLIEKDLR